MLSNKMTFSLASLVMLLAFGLVCFVPSVMADGGTKKTHIDLEVTIGAAESLMDVSAKDGLQVDSGRNRMDRRLDLDGDGNDSDDLTLNLVMLDDSDDGESGNDSDAGDILTLSVRFSHPVNLENPGASLEDLEQATLDRNEDDLTKPATADSGGNFGTDDIFVAAFDIDGRQLGVLPLVKTGIIEADFIDASSPGRNFLVTIHQASLLNAYGNNFEISELVFFIPIGRSGTLDKDLALGADAKVTRGIRKADFGHAIAHFGPDAHQHLNKASNRYEIELVDADQGDPQYSKIMGISGAADVAMAGTDDAETAGNVMDEGSGTPGVVSIMRTASRAGFIEGGDFEVRIILTEEPMGGLTADKIMVANGVAKSVVKGVTYRGGHPAIAAAAASVITQGAVMARPKRDSELGPEMIDYYLAAVDVTADPPVTAVFGTSPGGVSGAAKVPMMDTADNGTVANFPEATGRDNMYHSYIAMISPNDDVDGNVIVSVGAFDDNVLPVPNRYIPVTSEQRDATRLSGWAEHVRDARVMSETLSVRVVTGADTTSKKALATAAYKTHSNDDPKDGIFNLNPNLKPLGAKLVIPADGYLVLVTGGDQAKSNVISVPAKIKEKVTAVQKSYNVAYGFALPFPADNLEDFFRNGGTLQLVYADLVAATGSGHDDAKATPEKDGKPDTEHDDYTGYDGASTKTYANGAVIISEIMWGLNSARSTDIQYIELHNTTAEAIGIDSWEWAIAVGSVPAAFTVIDMVGNLPSTGYWAVPGQSGTNVLINGNPVSRDAISMSRVTGGTMGTEKASWANSVRRMTAADGTVVVNTNLVGGSVGTPGAANAYVMPDPAAAPPDTPTPAAPVAKADDIMISEIMVASNDGRLPQWIELANISGKEVSLNGWSIVINNDPADADVVGGSVNLVIGDVTVGKDQVVLIVSKAGRNSGVSDRAPGDTNEGDLDSKRIVDVQSQVSPGDDQYMLISEMGFRISLIVSPAAGGVITTSYVVGNLGMEWEVPMAEGNRSSIIRREMGDAAEIMGTDAAGWMLASDTTLGGAHRETYYGQASDVGTPGYDAGGALPVELSGFGAKRDPLTGAVVITWATQSELNNAGFFIKRSQQQKSKFVVVNPTMIAGAGTTAEKQSYTYTDATADPNVIYYYQIEDVSLDGNRQTLTRAHRLKGHVGAAGKATTTWGDLKSSRE